MKSRIATHLPGLAAAVILFSGTPLLSNRAEATILGRDVGPILIANDQGGTTNDRLDVLASNYDATAFTTQSYGNVYNLGNDSDSSALQSVTDSNTPGTAWALQANGKLFEVDYFNGTSTLVANLDPPSSGTGSGHTVFDSISNLPGSDLIYILRTGAGVDFIDSYDPGTGTHTTNVLTTVNTGTISMSDGPAFTGTTVDTSGSPALYSIATGGSYEVFNPAGGAGQAISTGTAGLDTGSLVSITNLPGDSDSMYLLQDRTAPATTDRIHRFNNDGTRDNNLVTTAHTGASAITDAYNGWVHSHATGAGFTQVDPTDVGPTQNNGSTGVTGTHNSVTNVAVSPTEQFLYIADDANTATANHTDLYDAQYRTLAGYTQNAYRDTATTTGTGGGGASDWADSSVTDAFDPATGTTSVWQLHTDGSLFRIDAETGAGGSTPLTTLTAPGTAGDVTNFDSITNLPGTTELWILRTDRSTSSKTAVTGANDLDAIDVYDFDTGTYTPDVYTIAGTGGIAISDGPTYNGEDSLFSLGPNLYVIATGGNFEVFDPDGLNSATISSASPGGNYVDITNVLGVDDSLFVLRDRTAGDGTDRIDRLFLDGTETNNFAAVAHTGATAITDTYDNDLFSIANGGTHALIDLTASGGSLVGSPTVTNLTSGIGVQHVTLTNLGNTPEPGTFVLVALGALGFVAGGRRRR